MHAHSSISIPSPIAHHYSLQQQELHSLTFWWKLCEELKIGFVSLVQQDNHRFYPFYLSRVLPPPSQFAGIVALSLNLLDLRIGSNQRAPLSLQKLVVIFSQFRAEIEREPRRFVVSPSKTSTDHHQSKQHVKESIDWD